jgi:uncharacterized phage protein (TIGR01671 family)
MKTVKYRSWNEQAKCFIYFMNGFYYDSEWVQGCFDFSWSNAEQFTGLHDEGGEEVYENDFIECETINGLLLYHIEYFEEQARFALTEFINECGVFKKNSNRFGGHPFGFSNEVSFYQNKTKVIGNIHENPGLKEKSNCN